MFYLPTRGEALKLYCKEEYQRIHEELHRFLNEITAKLKEYIELMSSELQVRCITDIIVFAMDGNVNAIEYLEVYEILHDFLESHDLTIKYFIDYGRVIDGRFISRDDILENYNRLWKYIRTHDLIDTMYELISDPDTIKYIRKELQDIIEYSYGDPVPLSLDELFV